MFFLTWNYNSWQEHCLDYKPWPSKSFQLCGRCNGVFSYGGILGLNMEEGYRHHNKLELKQHADAGCASCAQLFAEWLSDEGPACVFRTWDWSDGIHSAKDYQYANTGNISSLGHPFRRERLDHWKAENVNGYRTWKTFVEEGIRNLSSGRLLVVAD